MLKLLKSPNTVFSLLFYLVPCKVFSFQQNKALFSLNVQTTVFAMWKQVKFTPLRRGIMRPTLELYLPIPI